MQCIHVYNAHATPLKQRQKSVFYKLKNAFKSNLFIVQQLENTTLPRVLMVTPAVYPRQVVNYDFSFFPDKSGPTQLRISKPSYSLISRFFVEIRTFPWISRIPQSNFEANKSRDSQVMIEHSNIQIDSLICLYCFVNKSLKKLYDKTL